MQTSDEFPRPPSMWLTYSAAGERLGLTQGQVAARARRGRWPMQRRRDTGEIEVEVPGNLLMPAAQGASVADDDLLQRVAQAVSRVNRDEAKREREKAFADERAIAKARVLAPRRRWWRLGR